jgi:APA family basic amino acid/polyamine antiporter
MPDRVQTASPPRESLARAMLFKDYLALGVGTIIGVGWVIMAGSWLSKGGPLGVILGFLLGGLILGAVGLAYAELTPALPLAGGAVAFGYRAFGKGASFLTGWLLSFAYITVCPFEAVAIGWLLEYLIPSLKSHTLYSILGYRVSLLSIGGGILITLCIMALNFRGVRSSATFQTISTGLMLLCAIIFISVALLKGSFRNMLPLFSASGTQWASLSSIVAVLGIVPFFMSGFDTIAQGSEESGKKVPPQEIGKAVLVSILIGAIFYALVILALSLCLPWREAVNLDMPTVNAFRIAFGYDWTAKIVLFAATLGLITSFNGCFLGGCRVVFALGRGGLLPEWFGKVNKRFQTPVNAVLFVGLITLIGPFAGKSSLNPIVNVGSLAYVSGWFMTCLSAVRLRQIAPDLVRPYRVKNQSILYLGALVAGALILLMILPGSPAQLSWPIEYIILSAWMIFGFLGYKRRMAADDMTEEARAYQILGRYRKTSKGYGRGRQE